MQLVGNLKWRYASKKMDPTKIVSQKDLEAIKESIRKLETEVASERVKAFQKQGNIRKPAEIDQ